MRDEQLREAEDEVKLDKDLAVDLAQDEDELEPTPPGNTLEAPLDTVDAAAPPSVVETDTGVVDRTETARPDGSRGPAEFDEAGTASVDQDADVADSGSGGSAVAEADVAERVTADRDGAADERDGAAGEDRDAEEPRDRYDAEEREGEERDRSNGDPELPDDVDYYDLDRDTRSGLRSLPKGLAEIVGRRLVMAGLLIDEDPRESLAHAMVARKLASRIAVVREAAGVAAYYAGEWQTAISELRTAQRLTGTKSHVAVIADAERALGRPERAIDAYRELGDTDIETDVRIELLIVAAGARADMGHGAAGLAMLQVPELNAAGAEPWRQRLRYAYADALAREGRVDDARVWFTKILELDEEDSLGVGERLLELDGVAWLAEPDETDEEPARDES